MQSGDRPRGSLPGWFGARRSPRAFSLGSVADPDLTPPPAGSGVNVPILEACAVIVVFAEGGVTVVVIAREVTECAAAEGSPEVVMPLVEVVMPLAEAAMPLVEAAA